MHEFGHWWLRNAQTTFLEHRLLVENGLTGDVVMMTSFGCLHSGRAGRRIWTRPGPGLGEFGGLRGSGRQPLKGAYLQHSSLEVAAPCMQALLKPMPWHSFRKSGDG